MTRTAFPDPCLTLVTDRTRTRGRDLIRIVEEAVAGKVSIVQLRDKDLPPNELYQLGRQLREVTKGRCLFIVNDRLDIALAVEADGIHLPEVGLPVAVVRKLAGPDFIVGRSTHSVEGALKAAQEGADYLHLGTIFPSQSKPGLEGAGPDLVRKAVAVSGVPVVAIGGIIAGNARSVIEAGAKGVAVISAITEAANVRAATAELRKAILGVITKGYP